MPRLPRPAEFGLLSPTATSETPNIPFVWDTMPSSSSYNLNALVNEHGTQTGQQLPPIQQDQYASGPIGLGGEMPTYGQDSSFNADQYPLSSLDLGQQQFQIPDYFSVLPDDPNNINFVGGPVDTTLNQNAFRPGDEWMSFAMGSGLLDHGFMPGPAQSYNM